MIKLFKIDKGNKCLKEIMNIHYSQPKGFVGRSIIYQVEYNNDCYGFIAAGSSVKHLPGRDEYFNYVHLDNIVNNIFFHIEPFDKYPIRNFTTKVIQEWRRRVVDDWEEKYDGDKVLGFETLIELPRTGECYKRDGWKVVGQTKGFTCKRIGGEGTDSWTGKRVWNTTDLRPKLVLVRWR